KAHLRANAVHALQFHLDRAEMDALEITQPVEKRSRLGKGLFDRHCRCQGLSGSNMEERANASQAAGGTARISMAHRLATLSRMRRRSTIMSIAPCSYRHSAR